MNKICLYLCILVWFQGVELIKEGLSSYQDEIRSEALGLVCVSQKKAGNNLIMFRIYLHIFCIQYTFNLDMHFNVSSERIFILVYIFKNAYCTFLMFWIQYLYTVNGQCSLMPCFNFVTEPLSEIEDMLLRDVLPLNLKVDSAPFRQHLVAHLKRLLTRVRDGAIALTKTKDSSTLGKTLQFETTGIF